MRIGEHVLDLKTLHVLGYLDNQPFDLEDFDTDNLNRLMKKGKLATNTCNKSMPKFRIHRVFNRM